MLTKAIAIAATAHEGQLDKGGKPYILHCMEVLRRVYSDDEDLNCIAVLHDVIEDTKTTYQELSEQGMNYRVLKGIQCLTRDRGESYDHYKAKVKSNPDAIKVKKADLIHNSDIRRLKGVTQKDFERVQRYMEFYKELVDLE